VHRLIERFEGSSIRCSRVGYPLEGEPAAACGTAAAHASRDNFRLETHQGRILRAFTTPDAPRATKRQTPERVVQAPRPNSAGRRAPDSLRVAGPRADDQIALRHEAARRRGASA